MYILTVCATFHDCQAHNRDVTNYSLISRNISFTILLEQILRTLEDFGEIFNTSCWLVAKFDEQQNWESYFFIYFLTDNHVKIVSENFTDKKIIQSKLINDLIETNCIEDSPRFCAKKRLNWYKSKHATQTA